MNAKNISKALNAKMDDWIKNIADMGVREIIKENALITGGALVSLLSGEEPHDYDVYFKTRQSCEAVARYYADLWNGQGKKSVEIQTSDDGRITAFVRSSGVAAESGESGIDAGRFRKRRRAKGRNSKIPPALFLH